MTSKPLDLQAVDGLLRDLRGEVPSDATDVEPEDAAVAIETLLAALRAHRAALQAYVAASAPSSPLIDAGIAALNAVADHPSVRGRDRETPHE